MPELLALQRCLAALTLEADPRPFERDPGRFGADHGLGVRHQAALGHFRRRLLHYREAVRQALWEPMERYCPVTQALLEDAGAWEACRTAFLATRRLESPFYRDVAPTFLGWLKDSAWGLHRWPFLLELVHFELVKELVEHHPGTDPPGLRAEPRPGDRTVLAAPTQVLAYAWRVHEATPAGPEPPPGACRILAFRGPDGYIRCRLLTDASAALLVRSQAEACASAGTALGLADGPGTLAFLAELRAAGAIAGFT